MEESTLTLVKKNIEDEPYARLFGIKIINLKKGYSLVTMKSKKEYDIDKIVTKKTMIHLQYFFNKHSPTQLKNNNFSRRYLKEYKNKTMKRK